MSRRLRSRKSNRIGGKRAEVLYPAAIFAALGDGTRLLLVSRLAEGEPKSIAQLTEGTKLTRQAITKHLQVLEKVGFVSGARSGRENLYELDLRPFKDAQEYLDFVSGQWDRALHR